MKELVIHLCYKMNSQTGPHFRHSRAMWRKRIYSTATPRAEAVPAVRARQVGFDQIQIDCLRSLFTCSDDVLGAHSEWPEDQRPLRDGRVFRHATHLRGRGRLHPSALLSLQVITSAIQDWIFIGARGAMRRFELKQKISIWVRTS